MAPYNDNFANAIYLNGIGSPGSSTTGSTVGATSEAGEPTNYGKTVWYYYKNTQSVSDFINDTFQFRTTTYGDTANQPGIIRTKIQAFFLDNSGTSSVSHLTEASYLTPSWPVSYAGWDAGGLISLAINYGTSAYIRVDGVTGSEGSFPLAWDYNYVSTLGTTSSCVAFGAGITCSQNMLITNIQGTTLPQSYSFNSQSAGTFVVQYCKGTIGIGPEGGTCDWTVIDDGGGGIYNPHFWVVYTTSSVSAIKSGSLNGIAFFSPNPAGTDCSQEQAEQRWRCTRATVRHTASSALSGGCSQTNDICILYWDATTVNQPGHPNPVFTLYKVNPVFSPNGANVLWSSGTASATLDVYNLTTADFVQVTSSVSGYSSTGNAFNMTSNPVITTYPNLSTKAINASWTLATSSVNMVATMSFHDALNTYGDLHWNLEPLLNVIAVQDGLTDGVHTCVYGKHNLTFTIANTGYLQTNKLIVSFITASGINFYDTSCNVISGSIMAGISPNGGTATLNVYSDVPAVNTPITLSFSDSGTTFPSYVFTLTANPLQATFSQSIVDASNVTFTDHSLGGPISWDYNLCPFVGGTCGNYFSQSFTLAKPSSAPDCTGLGGCLMTLTVFNSFGYFSTSTAQSVTW